MPMRMTREPAAGIEAEWLLVGMFEERLQPIGSLAEPLGSIVARLAEGGDFSGKKGELLSLFAVPGIAAKRLLLVGLGKESAATPIAMSRAAATAAKAISGKKRENVAITLFPRTSELSPGRQAEMMIAGVLSGVTGQDLYRTEKSRHPFGDLLLVAENLSDHEQADVEAGMQRGDTLGQATAGIRTWVNLCPADLYPETFCDRATELLKGTDVTVEIFDEKKLAEMGMNCLLGVGKGSVHPPRLLVARYNGGGAGPTLGLVGKGVTFDSGGLSIKTADGMMTMKGDMAGAATVVWTTWAIARNKVPVNLVTVTPLSENMPSGHAIRPGDVVKARNGKTIEVLNTDAEGRLILADALSYIVEQKPAHLIDLATLTGACVVALGQDVGGVMANQQGWADRVLEAARRTGELAWQLPMFDEFGDLIKSGVADMKNIGGRWGGAITGAKLLEHFVGEIPWVHVDIAGPAFSERDYPYQEAGGTGYFLRSLVELAERYAADPPSA